MKSKTNKIKLTEQKWNRPLRPLQKTFLRKGYFFISGAFLHSEHHNLHPYGNDTAVLFISDVEKA